MLQQGEYNDFAMEGGILTKLNKGKQVDVVPNAMRRELVRLVHLNGNFAAKKIEVIISQDYYVSELKKLTTEVINNCVPSILATRKRGEKEGMLKPIPKGDTHLATYHIDHLGPMDTTTKNISISLW